MPVTSLRGIFDEDPQLYDHARPGYPADLFDDLFELVGLGPGTRVVEVGPGTGQATAAMISAGAQVVAVELGAGLAAVLRSKLAAAPVEVVVSAFEDWPLPSEPFDVLAAFTSWHWLDPAGRTAKAAAALRPGGALATVTTTHVAGGTEDFFVEVQRCYEQWDPSTPAGLRPSAPSAVPAAMDEVDSSPLFAAGTRRRYHQDVVYDATGYLELLATYSGHRALAPEQRQGLLACIGELIDGAYGGTITKRYLYELRLATRQVP